MKGWIVLAIALLIGAPAPAFAHGGGLNAEGCHTNRRTGDYHCHRGGGGGRRAKARRGRSAAAPRGRAPRARALGLAGGRGVYFANCSAARAAGAAPIRRGEPGYAPKLDRDDDGIACE
jgi:hypothetical protein